MDDAHRRTIIVDYHSLRKRLDGWYEIGELRQGRAIADAIPNVLDQLLERLGRQYGGLAYREAVSLKDYSDRRLLLREGPPVGAEVDAAVEAFEKAGFRRFVDPARRRGGSLLMEVMRDVLEDRRPRELVIATADPDVVDIVDLLRPVGVLTGLICVFTKKRTEQISGVPDGLIDLGDIADSLGITMKAGFELTEDEDSEKALGSILAGAATARWLSLEGAFDELARRIEGLRVGVVVGGDGDAAADGAATEPSELPDSEKGRQRYIESALERMNPQNWRLAPDGSGVFDVHALVDIAREAKWLAAGGWQVERLQELNEATKGFRATPENSWLGHGGFEELLAAAHKHDSGVAWAQPKREMFDQLYRERPTSASSVEDEDGTLRDVASFVTERLNKSDKAVTLVELANDLANDAAPEFTEVSADKGWVGRGSFLELIKQANRRYAGDAWILDTDVSPGYIRLRRHPRPVEETGKRPVQKTGRRDESGARSLLRTVVPAFPADDAKQFRLRAAVLATVLTRTNVVASIAGGPNPLTAHATAARDLSLKTTGLTGRAPFTFMLRTLTNDDPRVRQIREMELRLVQVTDEVAGKVTEREKTGQDEGPLLGTRALLRIASENFSRHLAEQGYGDRYLEEAQKLLGPSDEGAARARFEDVFDPNLIDAKYKQFKPKQADPTTDAGSESLEAMLERAAEERSALLMEVRTGMDEAVKPGEVSQRDDVAEHVRQQIIAWPPEWPPEEDGITLLDLHLSLKADLPKLRLLDVARCLSDQGDEPAWEIVSGRPYSLVRRSTPPPLKPPPRKFPRRLMGEREWFELSMRFWTSLAEEQSAVSWVEAARSMIRVERAG